MPFASPESFLGSVLWVNRRETPVYPEGVRVLHRDLEKSGPVGYRLIPEIQWTHPSLSRGLVGGVEGTLVYRRALETRDITDLAGFQDQIYIGRRGPEFFLEHWLGKSIVGWSSVAENGAGLVVPVTSVIAGEVVHEWVSLRRIFGPNYIGLRYPAENDLFRE